MSHPGAPMVYYGDEVGMNGGEDPYNRGAYPWPDRGGRPDMALQQRVRALIAMRHAQPILRRGQAQAMRALDGQMTLSVRQLGRQSAWVLTNNSAAPREVTLRHPELRRLTDLHDALAGGTLRPRGDTLTVVVPPHFGRVLVGTRR